MINASLQRNQLMPVLAILLALLTSHFGMCADLPKREDVQGRWLILGNTTRGYLEIVLDDKKQVTGSIYNQPIRGTWDELKGQITFDRFDDPQAIKPFQKWSGRLVEVDCNGRSVFVWEGTFLTVSDGAKSDDREYLWSGQSIEKPAPSIDLKNLQGSWRVESITRCNNDKVRLPDSLGLQKVGAQMEVVGNRFVVEGETSATFANDLQSSLLSSQVGFDGSRVMVLTTPNAQGWVCSYFIENDIVEIAYPHTTSCHRGSGYIVRLHRQSIGKNEPK